MKKLISVIVTLALCCMLAPAGAEEGTLAGTWYLTGADMGSAEIRLYDPEAFVLTLSGDNTYTMKADSYGLTSSGAWTATDSVLTLEIWGQTLGLRISGDVLELVSGTNTVYLSRTPAEPVKLPAVVPAETTDAFNGSWVPCAVITAGLYAVPGEDTAGQLGMLQIDGGKVVAMEDAGDGGQIAGIVYEGILSDGAMILHDTTDYDAAPATTTEITLYLLEDGTLFSRTVIHTGTETDMEILFVYTAV